MVGIAEPAGISGLRQTMVFCLYELVKAAFIQILNVQEFAATVKTDELVAVGHVGRFDLFSECLCREVWEEEAAPG